MKNVTWIILAALAVGCGQANNRNQNTQAEAVVDQARETIVIPSSDGSVGLGFKDGVGKVIVRKAERQDFFVDFMCDGDTRLSAAITPSSTPANVRINQIDLPDGTSDGPFGRTIADYEIPSSGHVRLVIGESLMQGDPWGGEVTVEVRLTR